MRSSTNKSRALFWQGDDARQFDEDWQAFCERNSETPFDVFFARMFEDYAIAA